MTPSNGLIKFPSYSADATMAYESLDAFESAYTQNFAEGFQPLQTYPAKFHNTVVKFLFQQAQQTYLLCNSMYAEMKEMIEASGQTLSAANLHQLKDSVSALATLNVATGTTLGGVKATAADWGVSVDATGVMSVNTVAASTSTAGLVQLNNSLTSTSQTEALTAAQGKALKDTIDALDVTSPTASGNDIAFIDTISQTDGKISATKKNVRSASTSQTGVVQLNSNYNSTSTAQAATASAVNGLRASLATLKLIVTDSATKTTTVASGTYLNLIYTAPGASSATVLSSLKTSDIGGLSATHAVSATYLRPANSTSTVVTADTSGNLSALTLTLGS